MTLLLRVIDYAGIDLEVPLVLTRGKIEEEEKFFQSDLNIHTAETLAEGAQKIVSLIGVKNNGNLD